MGKKSGKEFSPLREIPSNLPEMPQCSCHPQTCLHLSRFFQAISQPQAKIVMFGLQNLQPISLLRTAQFRLNLLYQRQEIVSVLTAILFSLRIGSQSLSGILSYRLQQAIACLLSLLLSND